MEKPDVELVSQAKCSGIDVISMGEMEVSTPIKKDSFIVYIFKLGLIFLCFLLTGAAQGYHFQP